MTLLTYDWLDWDDEDVADYEDAQANFEEGKRRLLSGLDHIKYAMRQAGRLRVPAAYKKWANEQGALWKRVDESVSRNLNSNNLDVFDYMLRHPEEFEAVIEEAEKLASQERTAFDPAILVEVIKEYGMDSQGFSNLSVESLVELLVDEEVIANDPRQKFEVEVLARKMGFSYDNPARDPYFR